ncbi:MAG: carbohydrate deacetylase [Negativicutes bacterium]|jgi:hypothetical protein
MLKLIINADDFGMNAGVSHGILRALTEGIVSDTTLMVGMPYAEQAAALVLGAGISRIGIHLTLTCGKPVSPAGDVPSLVDESGCFYPKTALMLEHATAEDVEKEYRAQIAKFFSLGLGMTHIDSHHHSHFYGGNLDIAIKLAKELNVPMRHHNIVAGRDTKTAIIAAGLRTPADFTIGFYENGVSIAQLQAEILRHVECGIQSLEVMCHPAYVEQELIKSSSYNVWRANELAVLTSYEMKRFIRDNDIQLTNFDRI